MVSDRDWQGENMNWDCDWICGTNGKIELFSDDEFSYNIYQNKVDGQYIQQFLLVKTLRITKVVLYSLTFSSLSEAIKFAEEDNIIT